MSQYFGQYLYQPLPPIQELGETPPFTRLLFLAPGRGFDDLRGRLQIVDLLNAPRYETLSYTWGTGEPNTSIWLDGRPLPIKPNLEGALRELRLPTQARWIWIDAICIDQSNLEERSRQVGYMKKMYDHSARVIVWLGPRIPGVEEAFELANRFTEVRNTIIESTETTGGQTVSQEIVDEMTASILDDLPLTSMHHLNELFDREYFVRSWCLQEIVAAPWAVARCGNIETAFENLILSIPWIFKSRGKILVGKPFEVWHQVIMKKRGLELTGGMDDDGSLGSLLMLLAGTRDFKATDPRDKIFSLFGIAKEGINPTSALTQVMTSNGQPSVLAQMVERGFKNLQNYVNTLGPGVDFGRPAALKADYTKDTVSVYVDLTRFLIRKSPRMLDVLEHVQHTVDPTIGMFPSWVPKWFEPKSVSVLGTGCFLAGLCDGHFRYFAEVHDNPLTRNAARPRLLSLDGFFVATVQSVSNVMTFDLLEEVPIEKTWFEMFNFPMIPRPTHTYVTGEPLDIAFCMVMQAGPLGGIFGTLIPTGLASTSLDFPSTQREQIERYSHCHIARFLVSEAKARGVSIAPYLPLLPDANDGDSEKFSQGVRTFSNNRRVFMTQDGRLGLGPKMMQPGDELVILFGGRTPFILRRIHDHHAFVGNCYVRDEEIMWGKMTEKVRFKRGGAPIITFELR